MFGDAFPNNLLFTLFVLVFVVVILAILLWKIKYIRRSIATLPRDLIGARCLFTVEHRVRAKMKKNVGVQDLFLEVVKRESHKEALFDIATQKSLTFDELNRRACQYSQFLQKSGFRSGDVVGILMENGSEMVCIGIACIKLGLIPGWLNTNLKADALKHCLTEISAIAVFNSPSFEGMLKAEELPNLRIFQVNGELMRTVENEDQSEPIVINPPGAKSPLCLVFTSGTTGLPKAAVIKHFRFMYMGYGGECAFGVRREDRLYVCLPLYHSSAGLFEISQMMIHGCTCVIRTKFSASEFWNDCVKYKCTVTQYIGEICRYLLCADECEAEKRHPVRLTIGNGLRPELWRPFRERFKIPHIKELFASTEGTVTLVNFTEKEGACGFLPIHRITHKLFPVRLFKINEETGEMRRNKRGYCIPCLPGDSGVIVSYLRKTDPLLAFEGYLKEKETKKKLIMNPLPGVEAVFCSDDLLYWDELGYLYFKDRLGDTFRWKGENVSTTEVEALLQPMKQIVDCAVYGVAVPGCEGQAGMLALSIVSEDNLQSFIQTVYQRLSSKLPRYAVPIFLRFLPSINKTGTFKAKKASLRREGFDVNDGSVYVYSRVAKSYIPLTNDIKSQICNGAIRL